MSDGFDVPRQAAPGPDDGAAQSMRHCSEQEPGNGNEAKTDDDRSAPTLAQPANAPTCRRSLFRR